MNTKLMFLLLLSSIYWSNASAQGFDFQWAKGFGGTSYDSVTAITTDPNNNSYTVGTYNGTMDCDPSFNTFNLTGYGSFVNKLDAAGNFVWAASLGNGADIIHASANASSICAIGSFGTTVDFDPSTNTSTLNGNNGSFFIWKLHLNGTLAWAKQLPLPTYFLPYYSNTSLFSVKLDAAGNVYIAGTFHNTVDFDPSAGTSNLTTTNSAEGFILKLDTNGNFVWVKQLGITSNVYVSSLDFDGNGNMYLGGFFNGTPDFDPSANVSNLTATGNSDAFVAKLDNNGAFVWAKNAGSGNGVSQNDLVVDATGNVYTIGVFTATADFDPSANVFNLTSTNGYNAFISKLDAAGNFVWAGLISSSGSSEGTSLIINSSNQITAIGTVSGIADLDPSAGVLNINSNNGQGFVVELDGNTGNFVAGGQVEVEGGAAFDLAISPNDFIFATGNYQQTGDLDPNINATFNLTNTGGNRNAFVISLSGGGCTSAIGLLGDTSLIGQDTLVAYPVGMASYEWLDCATGASLSTNATFVPSVYGSYSVVVTNGAGCVDTSDCFNYQSRTLVGQVYMDNNGNCIYNMGADVAALSNILVRATHTNGNTYQTYTDANGQYSLVLPMGQYTLEAFPTPSHLYTVCTIPAVNIVNLNNIVTLDLGIYSLFNCPVMQVEINTPHLRACGQHPFYYYVNYSNVGSAVTNNAYVDVQLDPTETYIYNNLNLPTTTLPNNTYRFDIGNVMPMQEGTFFIAINVACGTPLGQVLCTEAHIYPDTICGLNYTGPIIEILDSCLGDSILFRLTNTGGNMAIPQTYNIVEDNAMFRPNTPFQLNTNGFIDIIIPATSGKVYRLEAQQALNFPAALGDTMVWAIVQNCLGISNTSINFINQFYTNNTSLVEDTDCSPVAGSYDPNDKTAQQIGYGSQHLIAANTRLEYTLRFQNTGTDTAYRVVVLDTLDTAVLDASTIDMGTSSHNFTWVLLENHIIEFTFANINLVDSFTNEPASNGFVSFKINQVANLANGTVINNNAAIYFDNNAPIITNTCFHTIGENFIVVANKDISMPNADIKVYPNPFQTQTTFEVSGVQYQQLTLILVDAMGKQVANVQSSNNQVQLDRNQLPSGIYFYRLYADDVLLNTGKVIAQ